MYCYYKVKWNFDDEMLTNYGFAQGDSYADIVAGIEEGYDGVENIEVEWISDNHCTLDLDDILDSLNEEQMNTVLMHLMDKQRGAGSAVYATIKEAVELEGGNAKLEDNYKS